MDKFMDKLNFDFVTNQKMIWLIGQIDGYNGKWNSLEQRENRALQELRKHATIKSIAAASRLRGTRMSDETVKQLLDKMQTNQMQTQTEQELLGYYEVIDLIKNNFKDLALSESYIKQLHHFLTRYLKQDEHHHGKYKRTPNKWTATHFADHFTTTAPDFVEPEMQELLEWTNIQFDDKTIHPLIISALFIHDFLNIHPFQEGNVRLSWLLTTLCLLQQGYNFAQYVSLENFIEQHQQDYFDAIRSWQLQHNLGHENIGKWVLFFLENLKTVTENLDTKQIVLPSKVSYLNERQKLVKEYITLNSPFKISDLSYNFPNISIPTLKKDLVYFRHEQLVTMTGKGKGSVYRVNE